MTVEQIMTNNKSIELISIARVYLTDTWLNFNTGSCVQSQRSGQQGQGSRMPQWKLGEKEYKETYQKYTE